MYISILFFGIFVISTLIGLFPFLKEIRNTFKYYHNSLNLLICFSILIKLIILFPLIILFEMISFILPFIFYLSFVCSFQIFILVYWKEKKKYYLFSFLFFPLLLFHFFLFNSFHILSMITLFLRLFSTFYIIYFAYNGKNKDIFYCSIWEGNILLIYLYFVFQNPYILSLLSFYNIIFILGMFQIGKFESVLLTDFEKKKRKTQSSMWITKRIDENQKDIFDITEEIND